MIKSKTVTLVGEITDKIICDSCKREIKRNKFDEFEDFYIIDKTWGYESSKDGRHDEFHVCEKCYDKMIKAIGL